MWLELLIGLLLVAFIVLLAALAAHVYTWVTGKSIVDDDEWDDYKGGHG
jgi:hypothetical protein